MRAPAVIVPERRDSNALPLDSSRASAWNAPDRKSLSSGTPPLQKARRHYLELPVSLPQHSGRAAAERLYQRHCVHHAAAENIYRSNFGSESRTLSSCHLKVAGDATRITSVGECEVFFGCVDGRVLYLSFVLQNPKRRDVVLHLLKTGQHSLAIISDGLIVRSDGLVRGSPTSSDVEDGEKRGRASRPQNTGAGEQC